MDPEAFLDLPFTTRIQDATSTLRHVHDNVSTVLSFAATTLGDDPDIQGPLGAPEGTEFTATDTPVAWQWWHSLVIVEQHAPGLQWLLTGSVESLTYRPIQKAVGPDGYSTVFRQGPSVSVTEEEVEAWAEQAAAQLRRLALVIG